MFTFEPRRKAWHLSSDLFFMQSLAALPVKDREFHHAKGAYAYNSIARGLKEGSIRATSISSRNSSPNSRRRGVSALSGQTSVCVLVNRRRFIGPYRDDIAGRCKRVR
jgi:hypothetical protein